MSIACSRHRRYEINGNIDVSTRPMVYLDEQEVSRIVPVDSARANRQGQFSFSGRIEYPRFFHIHLGDNYLISLLIAPGEKINLSCHSKNFSTSYLVTGSEGSEQIFLLNEKLAETNKMLDSIGRILRDPQINDARRLELEALSGSVIEDQRKFSIRFILEHLQSMAAIYALYQRINGQDFILNENKDIQLLKITGQSLDTLYPGSKHVQALVADATKLELQVKGLGYFRLLDQMDGSIPDISLPDRNGDTVRLSSIPEKVVLISFWASWNQQSISHNLELKELYNKFHPKGFEIYQVSLDSKKEPWVNAIQYDEIPWINVSDLSYPRSYTASLYNITSLPATFLINRQGDVIGKNLTRIELDIKLKELLD
jgi:peroxiredoxin